MKTIATFGLLLCVSIATLSQNRNSIWCFGDSAGIDFRNVSMPVPITTGFDTRGTCASVSDSLGNLLFYSNLIAV